MAGVIIPDPKGGLVWIHAEDPSNDPVKIQATAAGILFVTFDGMLDAGERMFGYEDVVSEQVSNLSLGAGTNNLDGTTVPAGELWHITHVSALYIGTPPASLQCIARVGGVEVHISHITTIVSGQNYPYSCDVYLDEDSHMRVRATVATLNNDLYLRYCGTKQAI